jgi:hypothetical protein
MEEFLDQYGLDLDITKLNYMFEVRNSGAQE